MKSDYHLPYEKNREVPLNTDAIDTVDAVHLGMSLGQFLTYTIDTKPCLHSVLRENDRLLRTVVYYSMTCFCVHSPALSINTIVTESEHKLTFTERGGHGSC